MVEFVSYNGAYPNLCSGILVVRIDGKEVSLPRFILRSGGCCGFRDDWSDYIENGPWSVDVPEEFAEYKDAIEEVVNANIPWGCCGGCI